MTLRQVYLFVTVIIASAGLTLAAWAAAPGRSIAASQEEGSQVLLLLRLPPAHARPGGDYAGAYGSGASRAARRRLVDKLAARHGLKIVDDWPMPLLSVDCYVLAVPAGRSADEVATVLAAIPGVESSQPVNQFETHNAALPTGDPLFRAQPAAVEWDLARMHRMADGRGVRVAIIDSKIEASHPDLVGQIRWNEDFVPNRRVQAEQHGTAVAGIIAAVANNGVGIAGIAPRARLMALRACWQQPARGGKTICDSFSLAKAIYFAIENQANVINLSLGGPPDPLLARLVEKALARHIVVVAAYDPNRPNGGFPASYRGVVAVTDRPVASHPTQVYVAPGRGIPTTQVGGQWALVNGSSFSAAHVSGLFALLGAKQVPARGPPQLVAQFPKGGTIDSCATLARANLARSSGVGTCG